MGDIDDLFGRSPYNVRNEPQPPSEAEVMRERARVRRIDAIGADVAANILRHRLCWSGLLTVADFPLASVRPVDPGPPPSIDDFAALVSWNERCEALRVFEQAVADRAWLIRNPLLKGLD